MIFEWTVSFILGVIACELYFIWKKIGISNGQSEMCKKCPFNKQEKND